MPGSRHAGPFCIPSSSRLDRDCLAPRRLRRPAGRAPRALRVREPPAGSGGRHPAGAGRPGRARGDADRRRQEPRLPARRAPQARGRHRRRVAAHRADEGSGGRPPVAWHRGGVRQLVAEPDRAPRGAGGPPRRASPAGLRRARAPAPAVVSEDAPGGRRGTAGRRRSALREPVGPRLPAGLPRAGVRSPGDGRPALCRADGDGHAARAGRHRRAARPPRPRPSRHRLQPSQPGLRGQGHCHRRPEAAGAAPVSQRTARRGRADLRRHAEGLRGAGAVRPRAGRAAV